MSIAPDLFAWADTRPTATIIDATPQFNRRAEIVALRLLFGPPFPNLAGIVVLFDPDRRRPIGGQRRTARRQAS